MYLDFSSVRLEFQFRNQWQDTIDAELLDIGAGFEAVTVGQ